MSNIQFARDQLKLSKAARYFPIEKGVYEVAPGLRSLGQSMGNGAADGLAIQLDAEFQRYRENKLTCRDERLEKYCLFHDYSSTVSTAVNRFLVERMTSEYPDFFSLSESPNGEKLLHCALTGETLMLDSNFELVSGSAHPGPKSAPYLSAFDALCSQIQEDVAVVRAEDGRDWLAALHLCSPNHWSGEEKIGRKFSDVHLPVPGIEKINRAARSFVDAMIHKGPYVRFVWGFATDRRLNHHPVPAPGWDPVEWKGRSFDPAASSPFILRLERQVTWGLPEVNAAVFLIRTYFIDGHEIRANPGERALLRSALLSMGEASREYKGLSDCMDSVLAWLDGQ